VRVSSGFAGWRWRARWLTGFLVAMGALPVLAAGPASAATAPPWTILVTQNPVPLPPGANFGALSGVSCTSVNACIAVGDFGSATGGGALAERWDGSRWQLIQTGLAAGGTSAQFNAVSCTSAATCTAVGIFKTFSRTFDTLAERFVAAGSPHGFSLTARGTVLALLRKPRTLELLVFQRGRHGHLLGPVALGSHPRGLSRIRWNLRVAGKRLRAGTYTAELVAVFGRGVTSDGPAVTFDLTRAGLVRVLSATCSVTAAERGRC
jgi:hypothetical protein